MSKVTLANLLQERTNQLDMSRTELASKAGISRQTLYKLLNAEIDEAKLSTLIKLSQVLMLHPMDLLRIYFDGLVIQSNNHDNSGFLGDITYPDNTTVMINQRFTKVWGLKNTGKTTWRARRLVCLDDRLEVQAPDSGFELATVRGLIPDSNEIQIPDMRPGESIEVSVEFRAPSYPCTAISYWKMVFDDGAFCFPDKEGLSCLVKAIGL